VFNAFWALLKVFLDDRTKQKIRFVSQEELPGALGISAERLPTFLGGTSPLVFDGDVSQYVSVREGPMGHLPKEVLAASRAHLDALPAPKE
jgi:hypothetical protein